LGGNGWGVLLTQNIYRLIYMDEEIMPEFSVLLLLLWLGGCVCVMGCMFSRTSTSSCSKSSVM
jgi:uncharacterized membrane protein HdeD (DUF308 family)